MVHDLGLYTYPPVNDIHEMKIIREVNNANNIEPSFHNLPELTNVPSI